MNTRFLNTLIAVFRHGSMAEAARRLNVTHGAVAQQMKALEEELGTALITRSGKTVHLTNAAYRILETSQKILDDIDSLTALANTQEIRGELRLGAGNTSLNSTIPNILATLIDRYPSLQVSIRPGLSSDFYPSVENNELDAAIALEPPFAMPKRIGWRLLSEEHFFLLASARHQGKSAHDLLRQESFIRYDKNSWVGQQIEQYLKKAGIVPKERFELASTESISLMVNKGLGVAIVPNAWNLWKQGLNVVSLPLPSPCAPRRFGLIWARSSPRLQLVEVFLKAAVEEYRA
ncbi:LysR family transcriptional regulator [Pollutimonas bauzanensis]|uniref:DNA-binding transcriptional regulator, LysR family n=1 Tax=Pollutimonas bauzanensis TaxID=658167 RepID=A0A1M5ZY68_9BURK|nr:LysR family transcriptional regulator [Pollutimonas bauzanensis]SHI28979.1 DNA-binding transcriptional regulator, LysR family [Pollutimonas bauzanensis]